MVRISTGSRKYLAALGMFHNLLRVWRTRDGKHVMTDGRTIGKYSIGFGGCESDNEVLSYGLGDGTVRIVRMHDVDVDN